MINVVLLFSFNISNVRRFQKFFKCIKLCFSLIQLCTAPIPTFLSQIFLLQKLTAVMVPLMLHYACLIASILMAPTLTVALLQIRTIRNGKWKLHQSIQPPIMSARGDATVQNQVICMGSGHFIPHQVNHFRMSIKSVTLATPSKITTRRLELARCLWSKTNGSSKKKEAGLAVMLLVVVDLIVLPIARN
jgi:hypothetical protein